MNFLIPGFAPWIQASPKKNVKFISNPNCEMNIDFIRRFCLSFPQAKESLQWGETLCFKVRGKIFAMLSLDSVPPSLCLKCTPERFVELLEFEGIAPAPYLGRYKWALLERLDVLRAPDLEELIRQSYEMVEAKAPRREKIVRRQKK
jgi:predicted DNA-binding protein (MmcQ/YjbR family)